MSYSSTTRLTVSDQNGIGHCLDTVGGRETEGDLGGSHTRFWILAADGEAGIASGLRQTGVEAAATEIPWHDAHATMLVVIIGRCDGWMGLMGSRAAPLLSGCYISLRCGMPVGYEGCLLRGAANANVTFHRTGAMEWRGRPQDSEWLPWS